MNREILELLVLTVEYDVLSSILCNDYTEISADLDYKLGEKIDSLDCRRSDILTNMVKKIAPNA